MYPRAECGVCVCVMSMHDALNKQRNQMNNVGLDSDISVKFNSRKTQVKVTVSHHDECQHKLVEA